MSNFKKYFTLLLVVFVPAVASTAWAHPLRVVTTTDYIEALVRTIGGKAVSVTTLSPPGFDADGYSPRPQDVFKIHRAKVFIMIGLDLEDWARDLITSANNPKLIKAQIYKGIKLLDVPTGHIDYSFGDIHPFGNPHFQLDPEDGRIMASNIEKVLVFADPSHKKLFKKNLAKFDTRLTAAEKKWKAELAPYKGDAILPYHESWDYFGLGFGFVIPRPPHTIEEKPGFVPSPRRIETVIKEARAAHVKLVITEPYYIVSIAKTIAKALHVPYISVDLYGIGLNPKEKGYISMVNHIVNRVAAALKKTANKKGAGKS